MVGYLELLTMWSTIYDADDDDIGDDDMLFVNTNRISSLRVDDSESDSD